MPVRSARYRSSGTKRIVRAGPHPVSVTLTNATLCFDRELQPTSDRGRLLVERIESLHDRLASNADELDRGGEYARTSIDLLKSAGVTSSVVPSELGGMGVVSIDDFVVASNRLGRADGSTALIASMHLYRVLLLAEAWRLAPPTSDGRSGLADLLSAIATEDLLVAAVVSEPGIDHLHLETTATKTATGWTLSGRKSFATGSTGADLLGVVCRYLDPDSAWRMGAVHVPADSPGVEVLDNWDGLGMRASGSNDIVFDDCPTRADIVDLGPWGEFHPGYLVRNAVAFTGLAGAFLGIAETATDLIAATIHRRGHETRPVIQQGMAETEIDLAASRALVERTGRHLETRRQQGRLLDVDLTEAHEVMRDAQCTKQWVTQAAIRVVDRALTLSGGAGYIASNPLSRLYRDVRAGPFMQPFSPNEALPYLGQLALGIEPTGLH